MVYKGLTELWGGSDCEGVYFWAVRPRGTCSYGCAVCLEDGDRVRIFSPDGETLFEGVIEKDTATGAVPHPATPDVLRQKAFDRIWIGWTQKGWDSDLWANLFLQGHMEGDTRPVLHIELTRQEGRVEKAGSAA